jgi:hypothetical protein
MSKALKVLAFIALLPLVAVAASGLTVVEICTPAHWTQQR